MPLVVYTVSVLVVATGLALSAVEPRLPAAAAGWGFRGFAGVLALVFASTGVLLRIKRPESVIGRLLEASGVLSAVQYLSGEYATAALTRAPHWPGAQTAIWLQTWEWIPAMSLATAFLFLRFPDGRLPSPRWRPVERAAVVFVLAGAAAQAVKPGKVENLAIADNPWAVHAAWATPVAGLGMLLFSVTLAVAAASLFARRRSADALVRLQLRWLAFAATIVVALLVPSGALTLAVGSRAPVSKALQVALVLSMLGLPVSICVAVTRYRLFEIDRLISRTVSYAVVTSTLAGLYVGVVALSTRVLPLSSSFGVAASTLTAAAVFNPLRRRVQHVVDQRFNRARYDAGRLVDSFAAHAREAVSVDVLQGQLTRTVARAVAPVHLSIWMPAGAGQRARPRLASDGEPG